MNHFYAHLKPYHQRFQKEAQKIHKSINESKIEASCMFNDQKKHNYNVQWRSLFCNAYVHTHPHLFMLHIEFTWCSLIDLKSLYNNIISFTLNRRAYTHRRRENTWQTTALYGLNVHKAPSIYNKTLCEIFSTIEFP